MRTGRCAQRDAVSVACRLARVFDPRIRVAPRTYRRDVLRAVLAASLLACLAIWLAGQGWRIAAIAIVAGTVPIALAVLARTAGRLCDRGRSPWWLAAYAAIQLLGFVPIEDLAESYPIETLATALAMLAFTLWFLVETWIRPGTPGPNRFGPPPPQAAAVRRTSSRTAIGRHR